MGFETSSSITSMTELTTALGHGVEFEYLYFWGHTGSGVNSHVLSQWYLSKLLFDDHELSGQILNEHDPGKTKALGRKISNFDEKIWSSSRFEIVVEGNFLKFGAHSGLRSYLIATSPQVLVEASPHDRIWGVGLDADTAKSKNPFQWKGSNLLGFALMEARERLRATAA